MTGGGEPRNLQIRLADLCVELHRYLATFSHNNVGVYRGVMYLKRLARPFRTPSITCVHHLHRVHQPSSFGV